LGGVGVPPRSERVDGALTLGFIIRCMRGELCPKYLAIISFRLCCLVFFADAGAAEGVPILR